MPPITLIPTGRISDGFAARLLLEQVRYAQREVFRTQNQIASGRRIFVPSEDAPSAQRAMSLQGLIERKSHVLTSLTTNQSYLTAADTAIGGVSNLLAEVRAASLGVIGTTATADQRAAVAAEVDRALEQLVDIGNQRFRGRYLFSGGRTLVRPFELSGQGVRFNGNEVALEAYSDIDQLFQTNLLGSETFGALSTEVRGTVDLDPALTDSTRLDDLRGGLGIRRGSFTISDGTNRSTIDITGAETIGDVARIIEAHPPGKGTPAERVVTARVTSSGLEISLDSGTLRIAELGGGTTATELGILRTSGGGAGPFAGENLNPRITRTTPLADLIGRRARAYLPSTGANNDLVIEARENGVAGNGVAVKYIDDRVLQAAGGLTAGNEVATFHATATSAKASLAFRATGNLNNDILLTSTTAGTAGNDRTVVFQTRAPDAAGVQLNWNAGTKTYTISVEQGVTTAAQVVAAINADAGLGGAFSAQLDTSEDAGNDGSYVFQSVDASLAAGGTFNTGSDANTLAIRIQAGVTTAAQVLAAVNAQSAGFTARLDSSEELNNGLGVVYDSSADAAANATTAGGSGQVLDLEGGLRIVNDGVATTIDLRTARTVEDLLNTLNGSAAGVLAEINAAGTGIDLRSRLSGVSFSVGENGGTTATQLGLRTFTGSTRLAELNFGQGVHTVTGGDFRVRRPDGVALDISLTAGVAASATLNGPGGSDALTVSRVATGTGGNAFSVEIRDSGVGGGDSVALVGNTLTFAVDLAAGFSAQEAVALLAADAALSQQFTAQLNTSVDPGNDGSGNLAATPPVALTGGRGPAETIDDVLWLINQHPLNLASGTPIVARLAEFGNGIELVADGPTGSGALRIEALNFSQAAVDLGLVPAGQSTASATTGGTTASADFAPAGANNNFVVRAAGIGAHANGVTVRFVNDGVAGNNSVSYNAGTKTLTFDIDPASTTAQNLVDLVEGTPAVGGLFRVELTATDGAAANDGSGPLGTLPSDVQLGGGTAAVLTGADTRPLESSGVFTALIRLRDALVANDSVAAARALDLLDDGNVQLNFSRAELGARLQSLDLMQSRIEDERIELESGLSEELDVDLVEAASRLASQQAAFEAALRASAMTSRLTLLDFL